MPTYEFKCKDGHVFDKRVPMKDRDTGQICPECGYTAWKIFTPIAFVFRGSLMSENAPPGAGHEANSTN